MAIFNDTLLQLRHKLSDRMNKDAVFGTVASPGSGSFVCDETDWEKADDYFADFVEAYCYSGTGVGTSGKPTDWVNSSHTLSFLPAAVLTAGDLVELHRSWTVRELNSAINQAIDRVAKIALQDRNDETTSLVTGTYIYDLPATFVSVVDLWVSDVNGVFMYEDPIDPRYYRWVKKSDGVDIEFVKERFYPTTGQTLRIVGQASPSVLDTDDEQSPIEPEYIIQRAKGILHQSRIRGSDKDSEWHATQEGIASGKARNIARDLNVGIKGQAVVDM